MNETNCENNHGKSQYILLSKAKSLLHLIKRGSISSAKRTLDHDISDLGGIESKSTKLHRVRKALSATEAADIDSISSDPTQGIVAGEILGSDFQVETSAEEFFDKNRGQQATGTFHTIDVVRWEHDETDWIIEVGEFTPPDNPAGKLPTQKDVRAHIVRVRDIASSRGWLSPKSSRALAKLGDRKTKLDRSEINALNYLLGRCANISEIAHDAKVLLNEVIT